MKKTIALLVCLALCMSLVIPVHAAKTEATPMYRLYNPNSGEHFYTGSVQEKDNLVVAGWQYEGVAWNAPIYTGEPVYRLFNPNNGDHHYTMSAEERDNLVAVGWKYEGVAWNSADASNLPLYRLYNPNADCGSHHYTGSTEERDNLVNLGWKYEGIGWYGTLTTGTEKPTEPKPTEPQPTEPKPTEPQPTEPKPTEPQPTEPKPTEPAEKEPVTLRFWQAGGDSPSAETVMGLLLDKFEAQYPWITVEYHAIPWSNDPHVQFRAGIAGGDIADVLVVGSPLDFQLSSEGSLLALDDLMSDELKADIPEILMNQCIYRGSDNPDMAGKVMSLPLYVGTRAIMYNKEIFDYFGVAYPTEQMTHAELLELAKKLTGDMNGKKVYGYGTRATTSEQYINFVWNYGGKLIDPATLRAATDTEAWKKGIEDYLKFYTEEVTPEGSVAMDGTTLFYMFENDEIAMFCGAVDYAMVLASEGWTDDKLGIAPLVGEDYATTYCGADVLVVPDKGADTQTEAVALLVNYLMGTEAQARYCQTIGFFPSVISAAADPYFSENFVRAGFAETVKGAHYYDNFGVPGIGTILKANIQMLINGEYESIEEFQGNLTHEINIYAEELYG